MQDACWRQARKSRPALGCKDASRSNGLTQVDLLGGGAISFPDVLNCVQPYMIAAGLHRHPLSSGRCCVYNCLQPAPEQQITSNPAVIPIMGLRGEMQLWTV